eukprot:TRINITY_DN84112_c0_g1_i1.p2 TRINITY_DN84112_c0_g1~~TRINITY_DN84112_c0_g1_i1.p2  ORF type:complete len:218 (-),score=63.47 TRINITY_DN84112_c0_g1_i1:331-984(-)
MVMKLLPWSLLSLLAVVDGRDAAVMATGNPYMKGACSQDDLGEEGQCGVGCACPLQALSVPVQNAIAGLRVQTDDAFLKLERRTIADQEVHIYHFKQPRRLSSLELAFEVLPLRQIDLMGVEVVQVSPRQALDSWFPGYAWSILVCSRCEGQHLGWKFTPTGTSGEAFYALIVDTVEGEEERLRTGETLGVLAGLRVVGQPLAALGLVAASQMQSAK